MIILVKKTSKNKNLTTVIVLALLVIVGLPVLLSAVNGRKNTAEALAYAVQNRIVCPVLSRPTLVCPSPAANTTTSGNSATTSWSGWGRNKKSGCFWQCAPLPSVTPMPLPSKPPGPIFCIDLYCPLNCVQESSPDWGGCPICQCDLTVQ